MQNVDLNRKWSVFLAVFLCLTGILLAEAGIKRDSLVVKDASITGFFAFQSPSNSNYIVFVINVPDLYTPTAITGASLERLMLRINVDNSTSKDNIEDLIIMATLEDGMIKVYRPGSPEQIRLRNLQGTDLPIVQASLTGYGSSQPAGTEIKAFVSHQNDHFYLDLDAFRAILGGTFTSFNNPNPPNISLVIEVPKSIFGNDATINAWATSNIRM